TSYDISLEEIEVVPAEITIVLTNLIDNAWKAVTEQQKNYLEDYIPTILLATKDREDSIEVTIQDNGVGVSQELHSEIFKPFFTTKVAGKGTGLGLSIVHDIVVGRYHGNIQLVSETGRTKFVVSFPKIRN
ncbi:MAG: sensor histidine kinase, partial [Microcystaceae cyanobacterium]